MRARRNPDYFPEYRKKHRAQIRETRRLWEREVRDTAVRHYGGVCGCCGERLLEFLTLSPKAGKPKPPARANIYQWLRNHNYPEGYLVLCRNCAWGYDRLGFCPHRDPVI